MNNKIEKATTNDDLVSVGYSVAPSRSKPGKFRWWLNTNSDGIGVPVRDCSEQSFTTENDAWSDAHRDALASGVLAEVHGKMPEVQQPQHKPFRPPFAYKLQGKWYGAPTTSTASTIEEFKGELRGVWGNVDAITFAQLDVDYKECFCLHGGGLFLCPVEKNNQDVVASHCTESRGKLLEWTTADSQAADRHGWNVFNLDESRGRGEIQRDDETDWFATDEEAIEFVRQQAKEGDVVAVKALKLHRLPVPDVVEARKLPEVTDNDISEAKAVGLQVQQGDASHGAELDGRWWWTLSQPGWLEVQTSQCDFESESQAWAYAVRFLRGDSTLSRKVPVLQSKLSDAEWDRLERAGYSAIQRLGFDLGIEGDDDTKVRNLLASLQAYCVTYAVDLEAQLVEVRKQIASGDLQSPRWGDWVKTA